MLSSESEQPMEAAESEISTTPPVKKKLSERRLESLARARERASEVAKERRESKIRAKAAELDTAESTPGAKLRERSEIATDFSDDPIVVVEQSESDEEKLEGPPGVVFVRRKRAKPKVSDMDHLYYRMFGFNGSL